MTGTTAAVTGVPVERVILLGLGVFVGISLLVYLVIQVWRILSDAADAWAMRRTAYLNAIRPPLPTPPLRGVGRGKPGGLKHRPPPPPQPQVEEYEEGMEEEQGYPGEYEYEGQ